MENNELKHYGVLGMRWGVRRSPKQLSRASGGQRRPQQQQAPRPNQGRKPTEQEMRSAINRIKLEREYAQLMKPQKSAGRKFIEDVLLNAGKQTATTYTARFMGKGVDAFLGKFEKKKPKS